MKHVQPFAYDAAMRAIRTLPVSDPRRKEAQRFVNEYLSRMIDEAAEEHAPSATKREG